MAERSARSSASDVDAVRTSGSSNCAASVERRARAAESAEIAPSAGVPAAGKASVRRPRNTAANGPARRIDGDRFIGSSFQNGLRHEQTERELANKGSRNARGHDAGTGEESEARACCPN